MEEKMIVFDDNIDTTKAASATDCTGIIQVPPKDDYENASYNEVYNFLSPVYDEHGNVISVENKDAKKTYKDKKDKKHKKYSDDEPPLII